MTAIFSIARTTIGEAIRRKVLLIILLVGVAFLFIAPGLGMLSARSETTVLRGVMLGIVQITSAVIAIVLTVYMLPNEIERRTIYTILSKPVLRWQFFVGKFLGAIGALALMMALMSLVIVVVSVVQQGTKDINQAIGLLRGPLMYFFQMSLLAAVAMFFSTFVSPLVNFFLSGGMYLMGSLFNPLLKTLEESQNTPPVAKAFAYVVNVILPNFANYNIQNPLINPGQTIGNEQQYYVNATIYAVLYIAILMVAGIVVFDRREV